MAKPTIDYRDATPADAEVIARLGRTVFAASFGYSMPKQDLETYLNESYTTSRVLADLLNPLSTWIVAVNTEDKVVGFVQLKKGTVEPCVQHLVKPVELHRLYIDASYQGCGIGKSLATMGDQRAREMGSENIWLGVWEENLNAQIVYRKLGYERKGEHDFKMASCIQTDWILSKPL